MTDLTPITALGDSVPRVHTAGGYTLRENADLALASLAVARGVAAPAPFGLGLPDAGGLAVGEGGRSAFWTAPDQWMIAAEGMAETDFAASLLAEVPGGRVTEQTDGWTAFEIASEDAAQIESLLERLVNLPAAATAPGRATRTGLEHMSVFVLRRTDSHVTIIGMRTLAASLWHALETAVDRLGGTQ
ncbi:sarcosine oxidase subunit gamma [Tropicimonas sediminicola]|uniref:Sarcosine oxidase subunit gamma n=1 Tax=Tropicimonas sediminicola TaxID=1031541 RepID=A0A239D6P6_9RHOB|nr:sarcosine oxidase subunit gamma [Tropicimonas sediminicola]SNS27957.1 sarcosine oxidase subunit gamma [Tropicimonas sediminicola]